MKWVLTDSLPRSVEMDGVRYKVETDFRLFVEFERDMLQKRWNPYKTLFRFFKGNLPPDISSAADCFFSFYAEPRKNLAKQEECDPKSESDLPNILQQQDIPYSFVDDDRRIYASFLCKYGIRLQQTTMHWFEFCALFTGLYEPDFASIVGYRMMDLSALTGKEYARYAAIKNTWRVGGIPKITLEQRDELWISMLQKQKQSVQEVE